MLTFLPALVVLNCCVGREVLIAASPIMEKKKWIIYHKFCIICAINHDGTINTPWALKNLPFFKRSMLDIEIIRSRILAPSDFKTAGKPTYEALSVIKQLSEFIFLLCIQNKSQHQSVSNAV